MGMLDDLSTDMFPTRVGMNRGLVDTISNIGSKRMQYALGSILDPQLKTTGVTVWVT